MEISFIGTYVEGCFFNQIKCKTKKSNKINVIEQRKGDENKRKL